MGGGMRGGGGGQMLDRVNFVFFEDALLRRNDFILLLLFFFFEFLRRTCGSKANGFVPLFYTLFLNGRFFFSVQVSKNIDRRIRNYYILLYSTMLSI